MQRATPQFRLRLAQEPSVHHTAIVRHVLFSPDEKTFLTHGRDNVLKTWSVETGELLFSTASISGGRLSCFSPNGLYVFACDTPGRELRLLGASDGALASSTIPVLENHDYIISACFSPDGSQVAVGSLKGKLSLFSVPDLQSRGSLPLAGIDQVTSIDFSRDGGCIAFASRFSGVELWDVVTRQKKHQLSDVPTWDVSFSPSGAFVAAGGGIVGHGTDIWDALSGVRVLKLSHDETALIQSAR